MWAVTKCRVGLGESYGLGPFKDFLNDFIELHYADFFTFSYERSPPNPSIPISIVVRVVISN